MRLRRRSRRAWGRFTSRCRATSRAQRIGSSGVIHRRHPLPPLLTSRGWLASLPRLAAARRPIVILGLDLNPRTDAPAVRAFVEHMNAPVFVTPKAKGMLPEDHPLFYGVCGGVSADAVVLECFKRADLLVGVGFEPVESDKVWHHTMPLVSIGPVSIRHRDFRPIAEAVGDVPRDSRRAGRRGTRPLRMDPGRPRAFSQRPRRALSARRRGQTACRVTS